MKNEFLKTGLEGQKQYHIRCKEGDIAPVVIVPGDQGRVKKIIDQFDEKELIADNRGLITYTGKYNGYPVSVTSTGMGGPSCSIVYEELINIGAKVLIRLGSVASLQEEIDEGDIVIPYACIRDDGATRYYVPDNYPAAADPDVLSILRTNAFKSNLKFHSGINWTHSFFYCRESDYFLNWARKGVVSMEMEAAALFVISSLRNVKSAFVGICYANRYRQIKGINMDLSVEDPDRDVIQVSTKKSISLILNSLEEIYKRIHC